MEEASMKGKKWRIIFDYDDTLIRHNSSMELLYMAEYLGIKYDEEFKKQLSDFYFNMGIWLPKGKMTMGRFEACVNEKIPMLSKNGKNVYDFLDAEKYKESKINLVTQGTQEVLEYLKSKNYYLCILTNGFYDEQFTSLKCQGLAEYFEKLYAWDNYYCKPDKRAFLRALDCTEPDENVMVGNNPNHDIAPAKKLGIYTYGVHFEKEPNGLTAPDVRLNSLIDLMNYL